MAYEIGINCQADWIYLQFALKMDFGWGQTFQSVGIYLPNPVFSHGQLYNVRRLF